MEWAVNLSDTSQQWKLTQVEDTGCVMDTTKTYQFRNANSNLYLEVANGKAEDSSNVQQWGANEPAAHNSWTLKEFGGGYYYILCSGRRQDLLSEFCGRSRRLQHRDPHQQQVQLAPVQVCQESRRNIHDPNTHFKRSGCRRSGKCGEVQRCQCAAMDSKRQRLSEVGCSRLYHDSCNNNNYYYHNNYCHCRENNGSNCPHHDHY